MIASWIFEENLSAFMTTFSWIVGCELGKDERAVVFEGVTHSDGDHDKGYVHEFAGKHFAKLYLACDPGTCVVQVRVEAPAELKCQLEIAFQIFSYFRVSHPAS